MSDTEKLKDMLDNLVNGKPEMAKVVFHDYLRAKLNGTLDGTTEKIDPVPDIDTTAKE